MFFSLRVASCNFVLARCKVNKKIADLQEKRQKSFRFNNCRYLIYNKVLEITVGRERKGTDKGRDDGRDESLETPLNKGLLLKKGRDNGSPTSETF